MSMRRLRVASELSFPLDVVTQTLAAIGRKGAGKTYLATMIAEQMLDAGAQAVAVDPVGNWWGLRVGADGKAPGKDVFVLGGDHGDVPLVPEAGARIARLIVEKNVSAVLDVSHFRLNERKRFATDFGEELLHLKKRQRSPMHLFVEEAQLLIPQRVGPDEARMVGAFEQLVRLGRNYGIGCTLVTQRPQSVNKEVLSQVECLCVLQVTGPHERKALEEWVQEVGGERKLVGELPGLERGEGYVWSPAWLRTYQRVRFATKTTFDASATPEVGKTARAASLSAVDVDALRRDLQEVVAAAEQDDPKALRRRIAVLERELAERPASAPARVEVPAISAAQEARLRTVVRAIDEATATLTGAIAETHEIADEIRTALAAVLTGQPTMKGTGRTSVGAAAPARSATAARRASGPADGGLTGPERKLLTALAQHGPRSVRALALLTGYAAGGGAFRNPLGALRSKSYVEGRDPVTLTEAGASALGAWEPLPTGAALLAFWLEHLPGPERKLLAAAAEAWPKSISVQALATSTGYEASGGAFRNPLGRLRTLQLVEGRGEVRAADELFGGAA
jgi:hypothetical protein